MRRVAISVHLRTKSVGAGISWMQRNIQLTDVNIGTGLGGADAPGSPRILH